MTSSEPSKRISRVTRNAISDWFAVSKHSWAGRMEHFQFLKRLYDLEELPSKDTRFTTAEQDIEQHMTRNWDWEPDWVFSDSRFDLHDGADEAFLNFLVETVHPVVRRDADAAAEIVEMYNANLRADGYELIDVGRISDRVVYGWRDAGAYHAPAETKVSQKPDLTDSPVLREHLKRIDRDLEADPSAAITSCKNLIESQFKLILNDRAVEYGTKDDLPKLYYKVSLELGLDAASVPDDARASKAVKGMMGGLSKLVSSTAEARNAMGAGHGSDTLSSADARHARLVFNATVALAEFIAATWHETSLPFAPTDW